MRTIKGLLCTAALVASIGASMAQSNVYSLNVVGYVTKTVTAGQWYMMSNPLKTGDNTSGVVMTGLSGDPLNWDNSLIYPWNGGYGDPDTFVGALNMWIPGTLDLTPGNGFFFQAGASGTITFVGEVVTNNDVTIPQNGWSMVGSAFPSTNSIVACGFIGQDDGNGRNDLVYRWISGGYADPSTYVGGLGWVGSDSPTFDGPVLDLAEACFYNNTQTAPVHYVKHFTIN